MLSPLRPLVVSPTHIFRHFWHWMMYLRFIESHVKRSVMGSLRYRLELVIAFLHSIMGQVPHCVL